LNHLLLNILKQSRLLLVFLSVLLVNQVKAQLIYQPYSYQFYQKLNTPEYSIDSRLHTSLKPYFLSDSNQVHTAYDSIMNFKINKPGLNWVIRAVFTGHLADVKTKNYTIYFDYLPDLQVGKEHFGSRSVWLNTRGFQFGATIGKNFFIYTSLFENQGQFPNYIDDYIKYSRVVPSEISVNILPFSNGSTDWSYVTTLVGFKPNNNITVTLGQDKIFIGDGYRSLLLSDNAPVAPLLRFTVNLNKNIQYTALWTYLQDQHAPTIDTFTNNRRKWAAFHYLDWNISNRASLGFFNGVVAEESDNQGNVRGFDLNYINPILFSSSIQPSGTVSDNILVGFTGKYKVFNKTTAYGQLVFGKTASSNSNSSPNAVQVGVRGSDLFTVHSLNYILEYNNVGQEMYYGKNSMVNYTQLSEPLGDPLGSNFKEILGILNYSTKHMDFQLQGNYAQLGVNAGINDYGSNIRQVNYDNNPQVIGTLPITSPTTLKYAEATVSFILNPNFNMRLELGGLYREVSSSTSNAKTAMITIGLRSTFRNLYHDF